MLTDSVRKRLGQMDEADFFTILCYVVLAICLLVGYSPEDNSDEMFKVIYFIITMSSLHVYFQFWMMARNPEFRALTAEITGIPNYFRTMVFQIVAVTVVFFFGLVYFGKWEMFMFLFAFWNVWHIVMQTKGLYYVSRLEDLKAAGQEKKLLDLQMINYFLIVFMIARAITLVFHSHKQLLPEQLYFLAKWDKPVVLSILIPVAIYFAYTAVKAKNLSFRSFMILLRFGIPVLGFIYPMAGRAGAGLHGIEYYVITKKIEKRSMGRGSALFLVLFFLVIAVHIVIDFWSTLGGVPRESTLGYFFTALMIATSGTHFAFDGLAFRLKNREARERMLKLIG